MTGRTNQTHLCGTRIARGFSLLEVVLASLISMLVMGAALSLYFFVDGTDRRLQRRYQDVDNLQRIHLVMERVCTTLVMSDRAQAARGIGAGATTDSAAAAIAAAGGGKSGTSGDSKSGGSSAAAPSGTPGGSGKSGSADGGSKSSGSKSGGSSDDRGGGTQDNRPGAAPPRMPPRILLRPDSTFAADAAAAARMTTGPSEGPGAMRMMTQPQRLEVALSSSPVPSSVSPAALEAARRAASRGGSSDSTSSSTSEASRNFGPRDTAQLMSVEDEEETSSRVIRGALELRPQRTRSRTSRPEALEQVLWELWWVPLAPRRDVDADAPPPSPIGEAYLVASDIAYMQYRMFDDRSRKTAFAASFMQDIPAYVEVEVETARGLKANWLFEVSWSIGNEVAPDQAASGSTEGASKDAKSGSDPKAGGTPKSGGSKTSGGEKGGGK